MINKALQPGYYANVFEVTLYSDEADVVVCERSKYPSLKIIREEIQKAGKDVFVYAPGHSDVVYGYGKDREWLHEKGFTDLRVSLREVPRLTSRIILDGLISKSKTIDYTPSFTKEKGRCKLFNWNKYVTTSDGNVHVSTGYDIRAIFLRDEATDGLSFNIIVDACYSLKNAQGEPLNFHDIVCQYGSNTLKQARQIQKDLIPTGINTEASRQRLLDQIVPFVGSVEEIELPCDIKASVAKEPLRIIVGAEHESLW